MLAACGSDGNGGTATRQLTFRGDQTFFGAHPSHALSAALIRVSDSAVLDRKSTVVADANPPFSITFTPALDASTQYRVHYWTDSSFGGGTATVCDPPANDHRWSLDMPSGQTSFKDTHRPSDVTSVCATFQ